MLNVFFSFLFFGFSFFGSSVFLETHAKETRIVSLSPNLTEILFEVGLGDKIVGTSTFSNYPTDAKKIPSVGSYLQPNIERILSLNPTHVLVVREGTSQVFAQLKRTKLNFYILDARTLNDYKKILKNVSEIFKTDVSVHEKKWDEQFNLFSIFKKKLGKAPRKKILIQVDHNPIIVAGEDTFLSEAFKLCDLQNVMRTQGYARVSTEAVLNKNPEIIVVVGQLNETVSFEEVRNFYKKIPNLSNASIFRGDSDKLSRLSSRFLPEVFQICSRLLYE